MDDFNKTLLGLYCNDPKFLLELQEVQKYYEFYNGRPTILEDNLQDNRGQLWPVKDRDYKPTREIRNITKKLIKKQGRFMTSMPPTLVVTSKNGDTSRDKLDVKRALLSKILTDEKFWNKFSKAFLDCTIGKRVLLVMGLDLDETGKPIDEEHPIKFRFYTMPEFTYEYDPNDCDRLIKVQIAYQDKSTVGSLPAEQRWHKWTYEMEDDGYCHITYEIVDGLNQVTFIMADPDGDPNDPTNKAELKDSWNSGLTQLPCRVILNDGLTGDIRGNSDVKDLMDMAMDYNRTMSDYRDALKFKMFEQPVFTDADSDSIRKIKIAPNSLIDLKSDPTLGDGTGTSSTAKFGVLSSTFNFQQATDSYLKSLRNDMFEIMEQPLPESILNVPSGKALKMVYYDLITRCEEKWAAWDEAILWLLNLIEECIINNNLYSQEPEIDTMNIDTIITLRHNYPIPDDELESKDIAIKEVQANVRSHRSYIEQFGYSEDAEAEFNSTLDEIQQLQEVNNSMLGLDTVLDSNPDDENNVPDDKDIENKDKNNKEK